MNQLFRTCALGLVLVITLVMLGGPSAGHGTLAYKLSSAVYSGQH